MTFFYKKKHVCQFSIVKLASVRHPLGVDSTAKRSNVDAIVKFDWPGNVKSPRGALILWLYMDSQLNAHMFCIKIGHVDFKHRSGVFYEKPNKRPHILFRNNRKWDQYILNLIISQFNVLMFVNKSFKNERTDLYGYYRLRLRSAITEVIFYRKK